LHRYRLSVQAVGTPAHPGRGFHPHVYTVSGDRRWIAGESEQPGNVVGFELDVLHIGRAGADVFRGDVAATESLNEPAMRPK
jgi:hypothetical protein